MRPVRECSGRAPFPFSQWRPSYPPATRLRPRPIRHTAYGQNPRNARCPDFTRANSGRKKSKSRPNRQNRPKIAWEMREKKRLTPDLPDFSRRPDPQSPCYAAFTQTRHAMRISIFSALSGAPLSSSMGAPTRPGEGFARGRLAVLFSTARWGLGERFVWLLLPVCFWPVGGRGRCMRATDSPALAPVGSEAQGSVLAPTAIARCRNRRSDCVVVPLRSPVPTDRPAGLAGSARSAPKGCLFWRSGPS
jgi:hypothetical protein